MDSSGSQVKKIDNADQQTKFGRALFLLGGFRLADRVTQALSSEMMKALLAFQEEKLHEALGYERFVDFLEKSEYSPMSKNQFYDRKAVFEKEGASEFDFLNGIGVPIHKRKLLGQGNVAIEGDSVFIKDPDGKDIELKLTDTAAIKETLTVLADANAQKTKKLEKGEEDYRRLKEKFLEHDEHNGNGRKLPALEKAHTVAIGGLAALAAELERAADADCSQYADGQFALLVTQFNRINAVLCEKIGVDSIAALQTPEDDGDRLATLLDD